MVLYYNPCTNMFPSGATHHRLHQSVTTTSAANYNFTPTSMSSSLTGEQQNCYSIYNSNSGNTSNSSNNSVGLLSSGAQLGLSSSPISQYPSEITGLPAMTSEVLQSQPMPGPSSWYPLASSLSSSSLPNSIRGPASMVAGSPFDEWPVPNSGSPSNSCISGSPVSALPQCAYAAMSMPASYGQVGPYHPHSGFHRSDHYPDHHHHHHYHPHPHANSNIIPVGSSEAAPVHPSPDSGLTASSDGGTDSPNGQQNSSNGTLSATPTIVKTENGTNRPQPARSPYEWMKKPSYQNQLNAGNPTSKTRTKDKYRVVYSDQQRLELEKEFHYSRYITIRRKSELASMLGLSERQVKIWFQNRRAKERKQAKKRDEIIRKEKEHQIVHNHTQQIHTNFALC